MLKRPIPGRLRRYLGFMAVMGVVVGASAAVYASQQSVRTFRATPQAVKEAMALFDRVKTGVAAYAFNHGFRMPADDAAALGVSDPTLINGKFIESVSVHDGVITAVLRDKPGSMVAAGSLRLVPHPDTAKKLLAWTCESPDIPEITVLEKDCAYRPAAMAGVAATDSYTLKLVLGFGGEPPRYHGNMCLKPGHFLDLTETNLGKLPPWHGRFTVVPAERGQLEVQAIMSGGPLAKPSKPKIRMLPGQQGTIEVGNKLEDKNGKIVEDDTIKIDLVPSVGC